MKRGRIVSGRSLRVESLERRELLAGNVTVESHNGDVTITGDDETQVMFITPGENGLFNIQFLSGETVTGPSTDLDIQNLTVNLHGGFDVLVIGGDPINIFGVPAKIPGRTKIDMGDGGGTVSLSIVADVVDSVPVPAQSISIKTGTGNDVAASLFSAAKTISVDTGLGDDHVTIGGNVSRTLHVDAGVANVGEGETDNDFVELGTNTAQVANVRLGTANKSPESPARNLLNMNDGKFDVLSIQGGSGRDQIWMVDTQVDAALSISLHDSDDLVEFANLQADVLNVNLGKGDDTLLANDVDADIAIFLGGSGTDGRALQNVDALMLLELQFETLLPPGPPSPPPAP